MRSVGHAQENWRQRPCSRPLPQEPKLPRHISLWRYLTVIVHLLRVSGLVETRWDDNLTRFPAEELKTASFASLSSVKDPPRHSDNGTLPLSNP
jgi:hypothetical protein